MTIQLVENIMSREVITAAADMSLGEILSLLSEHKISFVVVREGSKPVGVITERDIVRLTAEDLDSSQLTARDVMSTPVVVSRGSEVDIAEAYHRLKLQNKRHLVIVSESGDIQGVVTLTDFIKHLGVEAFIEHKPLNHVLTSNPITVEPGATALQAIKLMAELKISCIIVAEQGRPVGILTERDVARIRAAGLKDLHVVTIAELMTQPVVVAHAQMNTSDASKLMRTKNIRHLIVVDEDGLIVGVVTETNIVRGMEGRYVQSLVELLDEKDAELRSINENLEECVKKRTEELTREVEAHKASQAAMAKLTQALEQAGEAVLITDKDGSIEYVNEAFVVTTGYSLQEVVGKNPSMLQSGRQNRSFYENMWKTIIDDDAWKGVVWNKRKDGEIYPEQLHIRSIRSSDDHAVVNYVGTFSDITEKMAMEAEYRHAQRIEAVGSLVGGVAHNFNNILAGMGGNLYLLSQKAADNPEFSPYLNSLEELNDQASEMVRQLLTFARKEVTEKKNISLTPLMRDTLKTSRMGVPEDIALSGDFCDEPLTVFGDAMQLQQVLMNLINNARDAMPADGERSIAVKLDRIYADEALLIRHEKLRDKQLACLSVEDSGEGISEDVLERIFEPFYSTKEVGEGTGLGLSMSRGSIESHGGVIEVDSTPGKGTKFSIYLPLLADSTVAAVDDRGVLQGEGQLILLVDDDPAVLDSAKGVLESLGYRVLTTDNGADAFDLFMDHLDDLVLILTDVVMPVMSGHELARKVRQHSAIPIIFMTGYDYEEKIQGSDALMATIPKPFKVQSLSQIISDFIAAL